MKKTDRGIRNVIAIHREAESRNRSGFGAGTQAEGRPAPSTAAQDEQSSPFADENLNPIVYRFTEAIPRDASCGPGP